MDNAYMTTLFLRWSNEGCLWHRCHLNFGQFGGSNIPHHIWRHQSNQVVRPLQLSSLDSILFVVPVEVNRNLTPVASSIGIEPTLGRQHWVVAFQTVMSPENESVPFHFEYNPIVRGRF
jgi:hypothetical protein